MNRAFERNETHKYGWKHFSPMDNIGRRSEEGLTSVGSGLYVCGRQFEARTNWTLPILDCHLLLVTSVI